MKKRFIKISVALFAATLLVSVAAFAADKGADETTKTIKGADITMPVREKFDMSERMSAMGFTPGGGMPGGAGGGMPGAAGGAPGGEGGGMPGAAGGGPGGEAGGPGGMAGGPGGGGDPGGGGSSATPAIYIDNGKYAADKSEKDAVTEGTITDTYASGVNITGEDSNVGGVYVNGIGSEYILSDATIDLAGAGSGLGGTGTGAISDDHSTLILKNCTITTEGRARGATAATNYSTLKVYNSKLTAHGEPFEEGSGGPPAALEISGDITCKSPAVIVKSQNAVINFDNVNLSSESGVLVKSIVNDDTNATKTEGKKVYGIHTKFRGMEVAGDIIDEDTDRDIYVYLEGTNLKGAIKDSIIKIDGTSKWTATKDSKVTIIGSVNIDQIDAPKGVTITATAGESGTFTLASGGKLILKKS